MGERHEFVPLTAADLPSINRWTATSHVAQGWPDGSSEIDSDTSNARTVRAYLTADFQPIGPMATRLGTSF